MSGAAHGNPIEVASALSRIFRNKAQLSPAQLQEMANVLVSEDPALVRQLLEGTINDGQASELLRRFGVTAARRAPTVGLLGYMEGPQ